MIDGVAKGPSYGFAGRLGSFGIPEVMASLAKHTPRLAYQPFGLAS